MVNGHDVNPANGHLSPWALALFSGDFEEAMSMLDRWNETQGDVIKLLEKRDHKRQLQFSTCKEAFCCQNPGAIGC